MSTTYENLSEIKYRVSETAGKVKQAKKHMADALAKASNGIDSGVSVLYACNNFSDAINDLDFIADLLTALMVRVKED